MFIFICQTTNKYGNIFKLCGVEIYQQKPCEGSPHYAKWNVVDVDYCMYGAEYKKRTRILTLQYLNFEVEGDSMLSRLGTKCDGSHTHVVLSGWGKRGQKAIPTKGTAKYPIQLARSWSGLMGEHIVRAA